MCVMKMIFFLRCDYVHDEDDLFVQYDYVCDEDDLLVQYEHVHDDDDLFVKYDYINGECDLLLRCYCVPLYPVQDFRILPAYRLARK